MEKNKMNAINAIGSYGCELADSTQKTLSKMTDTVGIEQVKDKLVGKWEAGIKLYNVYKQALEILRDEVFSSWGQKSCGLEFCKAVRDAVAHLCNVEIVWHTQTINEIVLYAPEELMDEARDHGYDNDGRYSFFYDVTEEMKLCAELAIQKINKKHLPLIHSNVDSMTQWIGNVDSYLLLNTKVMKAIEEYEDGLNALSVPIDAKLYISVEPSVTLL